MHNKKRNLLSSSLINWHHCKQLTPLLRTGYFNATTRASQGQSTYLMWSVPNPTVAIIISLPFKQFTRQSWCNKFFVFFPRRQDALGPLCYSNRVQPSCCCSKLQLTYQCNLFLLPHLCGILSIIYIDASWFESDREMNAHAT